MMSSFVKSERQWLRAPETGVTNFEATQLCQPLEIPMPLERRTLSNEAICASHSFGLSAGTLFNHLLETAADAGLTLDLNEHIHWVTAIFSKSVLCSLVGETITRRILEALQIQRIPSARVAKIPQRITSILHSCMPDHLTGDIGILYAQAKMLEFICELTGWLDNVTTQPELKATDRGVLQKLHEELTALAGRSPTLTELSRKYGRSAKALNQEFKEVYGCSIYTYVTEQRLAQAHDALMTTDAPIKQIAVDQGYSHVNHFSNAFRKKFGYAPGSLRSKHV